MGRKEDIQGEGFLCYAHLEDNVHKRESDVEENEELTTSHANSELSLHNAPITPTANTGNAHGATLTEGENCLNVLNFSTNHAIVKQLLVEPSLDLSLSQDDLLDVPCAKDELVDNAPVLHVWNQTLLLHINTLCILLAQMMS
ncbi:hypothetical protein C2845_PM01G37200 [Panicum miliaceum]|uniref:Uncharacterized protein n=1 Tax=Panicum miliaceum TaxID=4540 RepID=A0A3L6TNM3_PANMI|nr:hypothetical protein C2845_PM01G37200 [Panicum miliaceum]